MTIKNIKIESNIEEQILIEHLLNCRHSEVSENIILFTLVLHAFANKWYYGKLIYYLDLLQIYPNDNLRKLIENIKGGSE